MMKKMPIIFGGILIMILISGAFLFSNSTPPNAVIIKMNSLDYTPNKITIKQGQTVTFVNESGEDRWPASNIHPTHLIYPEFDPKKPVPTGQSWSFKFDKRGIWRMHDHLLPSITGTITVE